jgi:hypothetical protein
VGKGCGNKVVVVEERSGAEISLSAGSEDVDDRPTALRPNPNPVARWHWLPTPYLSYGIMGGRYVSPGGVGRQHGRGGRSSLFSCRIVLGHICQTSLANEISGEQGQFRNQCAVYLDLEVNNNINNKGGQYQGGYQTES